MERIIIEIILEKKQLIIKKIKQEKKVAMERRILGQKLEVGLEKMKMKDKMEENYE